MEQTATGIFTPPEPMSGAAKVFNVLFEPRKVFENLNLKPTWIVPVIIVVALSLIFTYLTFPFIMKAQIERIEGMEQIPEERKAEIIEKMQETTHPGTVQLGITVVAIVLFYILFPAAAFYFIFNIAMGGDSSFKRVLAVISYSSLVGIPETIVKLPLAMIKKNIEAVQTSLALFLSVDIKDTFLYKFLAGFDIFSIWTLVLFSIGLAVMYKFTVKKSFTVIFVVWLVWILIRTGLSTMFGGAFGF